MSAIVFILTAYFAGWLFLRLNKWKGGYIFGVVFYIITSILSLVVSLVGVLVLAKLVEINIHFSKLVGQSVLHALVAPAIGVLFMKMISRKKNS